MLAVVTGLLAPQGSRAQLTAPPVTLPVTKIGVAALISPSQAATYYGSSTTSTDGLAAIMGYSGGTPVPPEISDLARALAPHPGSSGLDPHAPDLIYQYIHNNIAVDWMYGMQKGPLGTLIDKAGTPFDQAALMIALLNQAGYQASYVSGTITLTGAQFTAWTGISDSNAACQMLANGGIPAVVNGSTTTVCATGAGSSITSVTMSHIWVSVNIPGSTCGGTCLFDPSYKQFTWKTGINLASATGFTAGQPLSAATNGATNGTISGTSVPYVNGLNGVSLTNTITTYAQNLLSYIENPANLIGGTNTPLQSAHVEDIIGGGVVIPYNYLPTNVVRQTSLPYSSAASQTWPCSVPATTICNVPDQYRTTLNVQGYMFDYMVGAQSGIMVPGAGAWDTMFNQTFFVDQIYGRRLSVTTDYGIGMDTAPHSRYANMVNLLLDGQPVGATYTDPPIGEEIIGGAILYATSRGSPTYMTLVANHPYAASADGTATTNGDYMDTTVTKPVSLIQPLSIVHGWGDTGSGLLDKWSTERANNKQLPVIHGTCPPPVGVEGDCTNVLPGYQGDYDREKMTASWLSQYTSAAHMQAQIAGSVVQLHHVLGFNYSDDVISASGPSIGCDSQENECVDENPGPMFPTAQSFVRLDIDSAYSVSSKTANQTSRNAAVLAIAAASSTLEGAVAAQSEGLPDTASTATRFDWGNAPPGTAGNWDAPSLSSPNAYEDPAHAVRSFVQYNGTTSSQSSNVVLFENEPVSYWSAQSPPPMDSYSAQPNLFPDWSNFVNAYENEIALYTSNNFTVTTSQEAFLGPGQRGGEVQPAYDRFGGVEGYTHLPTQQRGSAFVATQYDTGGNPVAIAHDVVSVDLQGPVITKGGGGGAQGNVGGTYDPSQAADVMKSQFVDKSNELGVNLSNGSIGYTAPAKLEVGNGDFPYSLSAQFEWNSAAAPPAPAPLTPPQTGFTTNWNSELNQSGSGLEAMGKSDVRAMVNTVATMMAAQDIYSASPSISTDASASLAFAWWARQINGNVVNVHIGTKSEEFLETTPGNWIMPGASFATLTQNGTRVPYEYICAPAHLPPGPPPYALSRGWNLAGTSFTVTNEHGDQQQFTAWLDHYSNNQFDQCGLAQGLRLTSWTFPQGPTVTLNYTTNVVDPLGWGGVGFDELTSVTNNLGREIVFNYDETGHLTGMSNGLTGSNLQSVSLGTSGSNTTITDATGAVTSYTFSGCFPSNVRINNQNLFCQIFTADNPTQPNLEYDYDAESRVAAVKDAENLQVGDRAPYQFYIANGARGERDDPLSNAWSLDYDIYGHPARYFDELGNETDALADGRGRVLQYVYPELDCELFTYDDRNNTTSRLRIDKTSSCSPGAGSSHVISISATWDPIWNKPLSITDGNGNTTNFTYYGSGVAGASEIQSATRPAVGGVNPVYNFTYDAQGKMLTATDPVTASTSIITTHAYDASENLLSTIVDSGTGHLNLTTSFTYDAIGNVASQTDPRQNASANGETISFTYDNDRRKLETDHHSGPLTASLISASRTIYDVIGRDVEDDIGTAFTGTTVSTWTAAKKTTYTPTSKVATVTDADNDTTSTTYDGDDRTNIVTDPIGRETQLTYDAAGHTLVETRALGTTLQEAYATYTYGAEGEKLSVYDADGPTHITTYAYDGFNRLATTTFPDSSTEQITSYDANSNILAHVTRAGATINETYDALNRNVTKSLPAVGAIPADTITNTYDLGGRKTGYSDTLGNNIVLNNDTAGRLDQVVTTIPGLSSALTTTYQLDANSNRTQIQWPDGYQATYAYDPLSRLATIADSVSVGYLATYTYDDFSRRTNLAYGNGASMAYSYTTAGDLTSLTNTLNGPSSNNAYTMAYTGAHELASEGFANAAYEFQPQLGTDSFAAVNSLNQYPNVTMAGQSQTALGYDGDGSLTSGGGWTYGYDAENKLMTASNGSSVSAAYAYDPLGRRTEKSGTGVTTTFFLNDGSDEIAEYDGSGNVLRRFVPGPAINEPVVYENCSGATAPNCTGNVSYEYFHTDHHGSVVAMSGASTASVEGPFTYDGYGNGAPLTGEPFKYVGMYLDAETGLYYDRARYYSASLGRFLQTDPIGYKDDLDLYTYVGNDPTGRTDLTGATIDPSTISKQCQMAGSSCSVIDYGNSGNQPDQSAGKSTGTGFQVAASPGTTTVQIAQVPEVFDPLLDDLLRVGPEFGARLPPLPPGMTPAEFGRLMGWGKGLQAEPWLERIQTDPAFRNAVLRNLERSGVTRDEVEKWAEFYGDSYRKSPNPQFQYRARGLRFLSNQMRSTMTYCAPGYGCT